MTSKNKSDNVLMYCQKHAVRDGMNNVVLLPSVCGVGGWVSINTYREYGHIT